MWKYLIRLVSSDCASVSSSSSVGVDIMSVVSSAYVYTVDLGTVFIMSLMYRRKKVVERVLPCGIPCVIVCVVDCACCVCVDCLRFLKYDAKKFTVSGVKLKSCLSLCKSLVCDTVSYALDRSMYIARVGCFRFIYLCSLSIMVWSASVVLELGLKAYCVGEMMLCLVRWFISCLFMMVSNTFAMIGSNDMGR